MTLEKKLQVIAEVRNGQVAEVRNGQVPEIGCGDPWCSQVPQLPIFGRREKKIEAHDSASSNPSYAKKCCIVRDVHFQKLDDIFSPELRTFLSYGHCLVSWCLNLCDDLKLLFQHYKSALSLGRHYRTRTLYTYIVPNNYNTKNK